MPQPPEQRCAIQGRVKAMGMDTIGFRVVTFPQEYDSAIELCINGQDFIEMVRRAELRFAEAEGHARIAGAYAGLPARVCAPPSRHFWGEAESGRRDGKVALLTCRGCGEIGCWPLLVRIVVGPWQVVWSEFEQPHRSGRGRVRAWDYDGFGPFVFDRDQYQEALQALGRGGG